MGQFQWTRNAVRIAAILFLIAPGREGIFDGIPLERPHEIIAVWALIMVFALMPKPEAMERKTNQRIGICAALIIILALAKIGIGTASVERGLIGTYRIPGQEGSERATHRMTDDARGTRRDRVIDFTNKGYDRASDPLPLWFMNDTVRFNRPDLDRTTLGFKAEWVGYIRLPAPGKPGIRAETNGIAKVTVDGMPIENFSAKEAGMYPIRVEYEPERDRNRAIRLEWEKTKQPVTELFVQRQTEGKLRQDTALGWGARAIIFLGMALIAAATGLLLKGTGSARAWVGSWRIMAGLALGGITAYLATSVLGRTPSIFFNFLPSGGDELNYETYARHIQLTGDWAMTSFEKSSYYYQMYYYFLVAFHYVAGERLFGIAMIQACLVASASYIVFHIGRLLAAPDGSARSAWVGIPAMIGFALMPEIREEIFHLTPTITGIFFATAAAAILLWGERTAPEKKAPFWIAGILMTLAVMNRYNFLAWVPCIMIWLAIKREKIGWKAVGLFIMAFSLSTAPFVIRNKMVANEWRLVSKWNSTINFIKGNPVPAGYAGKSEIDVTATPILKSVFDGQASEVVRWIIDEPREYAKFSMKKIRFALSLYPVLWAIFGAISLIWLIRPKLIDAHLERKDYILIGGFVLTQLVAVTIFSIDSPRYHFTLIPFLMLGVSMTLKTAQNRIGKDKGV